jgi:hypothetical protein
MLDTFFAFPAGFVPLFLLLNGAQLLFPIVARGVWGETAAGM